MSFLWLSSNLNDCVSVCFNSADIDECALGIGVCGANGACVDTIGSFTCVCDPGYTGNGIQCISKCQVVAV